MATPKQIQASTHYANILEEIRVRIMAIDTCTGGPVFHLFPATIIREFCFSQLRLICELIALGCLVAHGDVVKTKSLRKAWSPEKIMDALEILNPAFYPTAISAIPRDTGIEFEPIEPPLTKDQLLRLYGECGNELHRGNIKKIFKDHSSPRPLNNNNFAEITQRAQKLNDLLAQHVLITEGGTLLFYGILRSFRQGGKPEVAIAEVRSLKVP